MSAALFFHSPLYRTPEPVLPSYRNFHPRYPPPPPSPTIHPCFIHTTLPPNSLTADTVANGRVFRFPPLFTLQKQTKTNARVCLSWNSSCEWLWSCWEPPPSHTHNKKPNPMLTFCRMLFSLWSHLIVTVTSHFLPAVLCFLVFFLFESVLVFVNLVPGQDSRRIFIHILCVGGVSFWGAKSVLSSLANRQSVRTRFGRRFTGAKITSRASTQGEGFHYANAFLSVWVLSAAFGFHSTLLNQSIFHSRLSRNLSCNHLRRFVVFYLLADIGGLAPNPSVNIRSIQKVRIISVPVERNSLQVIVW